MTIRVTRDEASSEFFDAALRRILLIRRCPVCAANYPPEISCCPRGHALDWLQATGGALLVSWAVDHSRTIDARLAAKDGNCSIFGIVELDEGPWMQVPVVGADPLQLRAGIAMRVDFLQFENESVPVFRVVPSSSSPDGD